MGVEDRTSDDAHVPERLSWDQVLAWRLERHHLARPVPRKRALDVVHDLCTPRSCRRPS
jgi:hypothetical protein